MQMGDLHWIGANLLLNRRGNFGMRKLVRIMTDASVKGGVVVAGKLPVRFADDCTCTFTVSWVKVEALDYTAKPANIRWSSF